MVNSRMFVRNTPPLSRLAWSFFVQRARRPNPIAPPPKTNNRLLCESLPIHRAEAKRNRMNTCAKAGCNFREMSTYKFIELKAAQNEHLQKNQGEGR